MGAPGFGGGVAGCGTAAARVNPSLIFVGYQRRTRGCPQPLSLTRPGQVATRLTAVRAGRLGASFTGRLFAVRRSAGRPDAGARGAPPPQPICYTIDHSVSGIPTTPASTIALFILT